MEAESNSFIRMAAKVQNSQQFNEILSQQLGKYDLQPYKIENSETENILKIYRSIENKYQVTHELQIDPNNWNENERRLFVWFIICYTHYHLQDDSHINEDTWNEFSAIFFSKKPEFLHFQYLNLLKNKGRVMWSSEEDQLLVESVKQEKIGRWNEISKRMFFNSNRQIFRTPKHCRERWLNHLDENKKHGEWTPQEDHTIFSFVSENGKRWSRIVPLLNDTRTEHMIKNRYNSLVGKAKSSKKQKEEETARKILKQLNKSLDKDIVQSIPTLTSFTQLDDLRNDMEMSQMLTEKRQEPEPEQNDNHSTEGSVQVSTPVATFPPTYNYYIDFNTLMYMNQLMNQQASFLSNYQPQSLPLSKHSNFTRCLPQTLV